MTDLDLDKYYHSLKGNHRVIFSTKNNRLWIIAANTIILRKKEEAQLRESITGTRE